MFRKRISSSTVRSAMGRYVEHGKIILVLVLICLRHAQAADTSALPNLATLPPSSDAIYAAGQDIKRLGCRTVPCQTVLKLNQIYLAKLEGIATTMGRTYPLHADQYVVEERRFHRILLDHPRYYGPMCSLLTDLNSRYGKPGAPEGTDPDKFVGVTDIDLALRMDGNGPPTCLPKVLAAMPHTAAVDDAIAGERLRCQSDPIAHRLCARIAR